MSNAYLNNILFGISADKITPVYMKGLIPYMYTNEWKKLGSILDLHEEYELTPASLENSVRRSLEPTCSPVNPEYFSFDLRDSLRNLSGALLNF